MKRLLVLATIAILAACGGSSDGGDTLSLIPEGATAFESPIGTLHHDGAYIYTDDLEQCAQIRAAAESGGIGELVGLKVSGGAADWGYICATP